MSEYTNEILKMPELPVIEIVDDVIQVYKEYMVIRACLQLNLFDWIAGHEPATPGEISSGTGIKPEFISSLLGTLYYLDLVRRSGEKYSLSPACRMHFVRESRFFQGDYLMNFSEPGSPWLSISTYLTRPETKTTFESPVNASSVKARSEHLLRGTVQNIAGILKTAGAFQKAETFFEVAGGTALFAIAACQASPDLKAVVYAGPEEAAVAKENITSFGLEDRISINSKDIWNEADVEPSDLVLVSHALYPFRDSLEGVVNRIASWIRPGGMFISNHWLTAPPVGTGMQGLYELELGIHDYYHRLFEQEEFEKTCSDTGLHVLQTGVIRSEWGQSTIHLIQKP